MILPKEATARRMTAFLGLAAFLFLLAPANAETPAEGARALSHPVPSSEKIVVAGIGINTLEMGSGRPLLLLHGLGGSCQDWALTLEALSSHFRVIAIDFPGFGDSDRPEAEYSIDWLTEIAAEFLRQRKLGRVQVAGHSMGALVAMNLAAQKDSPVDKLIVVDAVGIGDKAAFLSNAATHRIMGPDSRWHFLQGPLREEFKGIISDFVARQKSRTAREFFESPRIPFTEKSLVPMTPAVQLSASIMDFEVQPRLAAIRQPVLIVWGKRDPIAPPQDALILQSHILHAVLRFMDCGHSPMQEKPAEFYREVKDFLQAAESGSSR